MLDHLRSQVIETIAQAKQVTLTTGGIAGLQTSIVECQAIEMKLYVLVPKTSDHLANLEANAECVAVTKAWELRGKARIVLGDETPVKLILLQSPQAQWDALIEIQPTRLQILQQDGIGYAATIDID